LLDLNFRPWLFKHLVEILSESFLIFLAHVLDPRVCQGRQLERVLAHLLHRFGVLQDLGGMLADLFGVLVNELNAWDRDHPGRSLFGKARGLLHLPSLFLLGLLVLLYLIHVLVESFLFFRLHDLVILLQST
jgi:hypothetical protein